MVKKTTTSAGDIRDAGWIAGPGRSREEGMAATPVFFPGESHGQRSMVGYSPWGHKESDTTERLSTAQNMYMMEVWRNK